MLSEREELILSLIEKNGYMSVKELAMITYTSESSIRRDLTALENKSLVKRTHGGVTATENVSKVPPFIVRKTKCAAEKRAIAKEASKLLFDGASVILDGSSSAMYMLPYLKKHENITLFTNNIYTALEAFDLGIKTYCLGGCSLTDASVLIGSFAHRALECINADIIFFSSQGIDENGIISDSCEEENLLTYEMLKHAKTKVFLYDSTKKGKRFLYTLCSLSDIDYSFTSED